eukprot:352578-Chlamydomonas_euryale.AAC.7
MALAQAWPVRRSGIHTSADYTRWGVMRANLIHTSVGPHSHPSAEGYDVAQLTMKFGLQLNIWYGCSTSAYLHAHEGERPRECGWAVSAACYASTLLQHQAMAWPGFCFHARSNAEGFTLNSPRRASRLLPPKGSIRLGALTLNTVKGIRAAGAAGTGGLAPEFGNARIRRRWHLVQLTVRGSAVSRLNSPSRRRAGQRQPAVAHRLRRADVASVAGAWRLGVEAELADAHRRVDRALLDRNGVVGAGAACRASGRDGVGVDGTHITKRASRRVLEVPRLARHARKVLVRVLAGAGRADGHVAVGLRHHERARRHLDRRDD